MIDIMNIENLKTHIPDNIYNQIPLLINDYNINTPLRLGHFLSQCSHESSNFKKVEENLNYSSKRLVEVFKKYFPTIESTNGYSNNPSKIASKVYANRMGNGDERSGDGYKYRGRGYIQLTGKNMYDKFGDAINIDLISKPDLVSTQYPLVSAGWFFVNNNLLNISDLGNNRNVVLKITKVINGGTNGLEERINKFNFFYDKLK